MKCRHETPCSKRCLLGTGEIEPCRGYDKCKDFQPNYTTNADRIRAMSDEALARFIESIGEYVAKGTYCTELLNVKDFPYSCMDNKECCVKHVCDWLKQPTEEEDDGN